MGEKSVCAKMPNLRSEHLEQVTLAYSFDKAVWSTVGQCGPTHRHNQLHQVRDTNPHH